MNNWNHNHILDLSTFSLDDYNTVLELTTRFKDIHKSSSRKLPALQGRLIANLFFEPSTRTRTSFELAAKRFGLNQNHNNLLLSPENDFWLTKGKNLKKMGRIIQTTRIGISKAKDIPWRWYLESSRSISKRAKGDKTPPTNQCWKPSSFEGL